MEKKLDVKKILKIISVCILVLGIISGICTTIELLGKFDTSTHTYVDGSDFKTLILVIGKIFAYGIGVVTVIYSLVAILIIWIIYLVITRIKKIINKKKQ